MGKTKKRSKASKARFNSQNYLQGAAAADTSNDIKIINEKVRPVLEKLVSNDITDKTMAISTIGTMIEDPKQRTLLLKEKLLKTLLETSIKDDNVQFVSEVLGLLRNISIEEGYDVCIFLWRQNIIEYMKKGLNIIQEAFTGGNIPQAVEFTENLIGLISALANSTEDIFEQITKDLSPRLGEILVFVLGKGIEHKQSELVSVVLEALFVLSEENPVFTNSILSAGLGELNEQELTPSSVVYLYGLKFNLNNTDLLLIQQKLVEVIKTTNVEEVVKNSQVAKSRNLINAVQVAIEIVTSIAEKISVDQPVDEAKEQADEEMLDDSKDDDDEEFYIQKVKAINNDEVDTSVFDEKQFSDNNMEPVFAFLLKEALPAITTLIPYTQFQSRAMAAINNISWSMSSKAQESQTWKSHAEELWTNILPLVKSSSELEVKVSGMGILWAVSSTFDGKVPIEEADLMVLVEKTEADEDYLVNLVGLLAQLALASKFVQKITEFFVSIIMAANTKSPKYSQKVVIETLYGLFKVFGDGSYPYDEEIYVKGGLNLVLAQHVAPIRRYFKKIDKVKDGFLRSRADEALLNLVRFLDYKKSERQQDN
ncbi:hypothetical protein D0Z03_000287 [Geotrichum reessii]|nr:hypothetical protein D0Z03_000287 [Galactomyces reessii]